jgi:membrane-associated phospholipid phosphatase
MGFHWLPWATWIYSHHVLKVALFLAYDSIFLQGFASVAFFALTRNTQRNRELLWITMLAAIGTVVLSGFGPALGPMTNGHLPWTTVLLKIRDGSMTSTALWDMKGIVAFPSFHTVLGVVFLYVHRPPSKTFIPIALLNGIMLLGIPFMGHHYLSDVIAGAAVTTIAIIAYRFATAPVRERTGVRVLAQSPIADYQVEALKR